MSDENAQSKCPTSRFVAGILLEALGVTVGIGAFEKASCHSGEVAGLVVAAALVVTGLCEILPFMPCDHPNIYRT